MGRFENLSDDELCARAVLLRSMLDDSTGRGRKRFRMQLAALVQHARSRYTPGAPYRKVWIP